MVTQPVRKTDAREGVARQEPRCSIARSMQVVGDKWSILIVRDAFRGLSRFTEFKTSLGIPTDILSARLATLTEAGLLEQRPYRDAGARERSGYHLTEAGQALLPALTALLQWGDEYRPSGYGPSRFYQRAETGERLRVAFVTDAGEIVAAEDVEVVAGPGEPNPDLEPYRPIAAAPQPAESAASRA